MGKTLVFALMMTLCLPLCGCGEKDERQTEDIQLSFQAITAATAEAELTCHYGEEVRTYVLHCDYTPETSQVTVVEPADLSGVSATFSGEEMTLAYEDVMLDAGIYSGTNISPLWALPSLLRAIGNGYPLEYCQEDLGDVSCLRATFEVTDGAGEKQLFAVWFDQGGTPLQGEITMDDTVIYTMTFIQFTSEEPSNGTTSAEDLGGD